MKLRIYTVHRVLNLVLKFQVRHLTGSMDGNAFKIAARERLSSTNIIVRIEV